MTGIYNVTKFVDRPRLLPRPRTGRWAHRSGLAANYIYIYIYVYIYIYIIMFIIIIIIIITIIIIMIIIIIILLMDRPRTSK